LETPQLDTEGENTTPQPSDETTPGTPTSSD
jgi:hypothetical protein